MNRLARSILLFSIGLVMARLLWTGGFGWFVQQRMRFPLLAAAVVLILFGLYEIVSSLREEGRDPDSSKRAAGPFVGWLLSLPLLVLASVAPTGLGAAAANRVDSYSSVEIDTGYEPLAPSSTPIPMQVSEFQGRAIWEEAQSMDGVPVLLEGLVVNDETVPDGFKLTRFLVSCCAADGIPVQVVLRDVGQQFEDDMWVRAEVVWRPPEVPYQDQEGEWEVEADVVRIEVEPNPPNDAYESPY